MEYFGLLAFASATIAYFHIITDYGFNLTATREISINRDNKAKVVRIFSSVMTIKFILMFISFALLSILVFSFEKFAKDWELYFLTFGTVIGQTLFPIWFFQGMERMKYITYLNILAKSISTVAIFIFVKDQNDFIIVPILVSFGFMVVGVWSQVIIKKEFEIGFEWQKIETINYYLKNGWHVFISNVAIGLYTTSTIFILGIFTNNTIVGYFAAADKLMKVFKTLMIPVTQAIYPYISKKITISKEAGLKIIRKVSVYVGIFTGLISLCIFVFAESLVNIIFGEHFHNTIILLRIMAILPFMIGLSNVFGILGLFGMGYQKLFSKFIIKISIFHVLYLILLIYLNQDIGAAIALVFTETLVTYNSIIKFNNVKNGLL